MRICIFSEDFLPYVNGTTTRVVETAKELHRLGNEVFIFTPIYDGSDYDWAKIYKLPGVPLPIYPDYKMAIAGGRTYQLLKEIKPDVIQLFMPNILATSGVILGKRLKIPTVSSYEAIPPYLLDYYNVGWLEKPYWFLVNSVQRNVDVSLTISTPMRILMAEHGIKNVKLWPGSVDTTLFNPSNKSASMRNWLSQDQPDCHLLLYVGRLASEKNIEAIKEVLQNVPNTRLALVGQGPYRAFLEKHFAGLPVFFAGELTGKPLAQAYASADVFVFPSYVESFGLVLLEAMASGLPIVAGRAGGVTDFVKSGEHGYLFTPYDMPDFVRGVNQIVNDPALRQHLASQATIEAQKWTWQRNTARLLEIYQEVIG